MASRAILEQLQLPGTKHKVIGLVSGGKDSCFNLLHCLANGHDIVALANLTPAPGIDELDSHLYQSVGTALLPLMAEAMDLPLHQRIIKGKAVDRGAEYGSRVRGGSGSGTDGDETEDLTTLLQEVLAAHPDATALSSGAILSNYQRLRIEHVCTRLGLVSLSYLWQTPQLDLLDALDRAEIDAVLVKVAGVGLGAKLLGRPLSSARQLLERLKDQYGSHPAGEGGEYETLTLSTPLFRRRLAIRSSEVVVTDPEPHTVAHLRIHDAVLENKQGWSRPAVRQLRDMLRLDERDPLDEAGQDRLRGLRRISYPGQRTGALPNTPFYLPSTGLAPEPSAPFTVRFNRRGRWFAVSIDGPPALTTPSVSGDASVGDDLRRCFEAVVARLAKDGLSLPLHATHITLLLSSMALFAPANKVYASFFGTSPPSRATVALPLPDGQRIRLEVIGFDDRPSTQKGGPAVGARQALHVQSLSYWAPANIGPYSQAVIVADRLHMAGQIPLVPASLTLPPSPPSSSPASDALSASPYPYQSLLALQHVERILEVLRSKESTGGGWTGWGESGVGWWAAEAADAQAEAGAEVGEAEMGGWAVRQAWTIWADENGFKDAPAIFVRAKELPRGALVEFQVNVHIGRHSAAALGAADGQDAGTVDVGSDDDEVVELRPVYRRVDEVEDFVVETAETSAGPGSGLRAVVFLEDAETLSSCGVEAHLPPHARVVSVKIFHLPSVDISTVMAVLEGLCVTAVPVEEIADRRGKRYAIALEMFGV